MVASWPWVVTTRGLLLLETVGSTQSFPVMPIRQKNSMAAQKIPGAACACWLVHWKCTATVNAIKAQLHLTDTTFINRKYYLDLCQFCLFFLHLIFLTISERVIMLYVLNRGAS